MANTDQTNKKVLIFTAHPDDHVCCVGTLMYLKDLGFSITEVVFTSGEKSVNLSVKDGKTSATRLKGLRQEELAIASKIIGIEKTIYLDLPDSEIIRTFSLLKKLIRIIRQEHPQVIFMMHPSDSHFDHKEVGKIATEAVERAAWINSKELGKSHSTPIVLYIEGISFIRSNVLVDITKYADRKNKVVETYKSQVTLLEKRMLEGMNAYHGYQNGTLVAESFEVATNLPIRFNELTKLFGE